MMQFRTALADAAKQSDLSVTDDQLDLCSRYAEMLLDWNQRVNLTRIVEPEEVAVKHFIDSAMLLRYGLLPATGRLIDVGTGAGFPGLVLKILMPELQVTLLDSVGKRLRFLEAVIEELSLTGIETLHARAEDAGRNEALRARFDVATARAVADLRVLAEYLLPMVRVGGKMVALKGPEVEDEVEGAKEAVRLLGGGKAESVSFHLPNDAGGRTLVWYTKERATPKAYPRKAGEPSRRPLG